MTVIVGGGLAGLSLALALAPKPVLVLTRPFGCAMSSSELAQGGIACALGATDSPQDHAADTMAAGAGLCDPQAVAMVTREGPEAIAQLQRWGVAFDHQADGKLVLGLEGAHGQRRIVHAKGDSTGATVMQALVEKVRQTPSVRVIEGATVHDILTDDKGVCGLTFSKEGEGALHRLSTDAVVLATGSASALWRYATVPVASWGSGLLLAARAGALLRDLEFLQFHPTALNSGLDPMPLISEALRGEGAKLVNDRGESFVDELSARDIVARANEAQLSQGRKVFLDARHIHDFDTHFPTILEYCLRGGIDPRAQLIPIRPVAHYHMGGIATDLFGKTCVDGLYACGECACTGLHGANRLASNSLLEAVVMGRRLASVVSSGALDAGPQIETLDQPMPPREDPETVLRVRYVMSSCVGLSRAATGLADAVESLSPLASTSDHALLGLMVAMAALDRTESRGAHDRSDMPQTNPALAFPTFVSLASGKIAFEKKKRAA